MNIGLASAGPGRSKATPPPSGKDGQPISQQAESTVSSAPRSIYTFSSSHSLLLGFLPKTQRRPELFRSPVSGLRRTAVHDSFANSSLPFPRAPRDKAHHPPARKQRPRSEAVLGTAHNKKNCRTRCPASKRAQCELRGRCSVRGEVLLTVF